MRSISFMVFTSQPLSENCSGARVSRSTLPSEENHFQLLDDESGEFHTLKVRNFSDETVHFYLTTYRDAVNAAKKRGDAQTAREVEVSLPRELSSAQQRALIVDYVQRTFVAPGMVADIGIHAGHHPDEPNPHAHILLTTRPLTPDGFGPKNRDWNRKDQLVAWRHGWAAAVNQALEQAGHPDRVDARSFQARDIDQLPTVHEGVATRAMERRGVATERGQLNRDVQAHNATVIALDAVRAERQALREALAAEAPTPAPVQPTALQASYDALHAALSDPQVRRWAWMDARSREASFAHTFAAEWQTTQGLTLAQTQHAAQTATNRVHTLTSDKEAGERAAEKLAHYDGWAGRKFKKQAFPKGRHRTEQGYDETFEAWQRQQQAIVTQGQAAQAALPAAKQQADEAQHRVDQAAWQMPQDRQAAWNRLALALQHADVAAARYHQMVTQATTQALKARAQRQGLPWRVGDPTRAYGFASRVAQQALQQAFQTPGPRTPAPTSGAPNAGGITRVLSGIIQGLAQRDRAITQRPHTAHTEELEQTVMNPLLDPTTRAQLEAILHKIKARENGGPQYEH